ncbi:PTS system mannose/fructose/sorbose family transporter subunit IID [Enterococcus sp. CSURQ0835]|uniref:PTS system mannose/fructose/sorbose family transporter subunit IID n=1 Tax=Enterococcus sp. CSURQ0835 TaxID=2681394 RepID=UPI001359B665|nr:PTS system mannose/fructose/sorbose family transporter subunit IID [Enterococcus sp. CSURQ0835]
MNNTGNTKKLTKKDLWKTNIRFLYSSQINWNYERMMSSGYLYSMLPILKKLYPEKDDLRDMMKMQNQFYNTASSMGHIILGLDIAIEEQEGRDAYDIIPGIKTGLMGPLAGVGDSLWGVIWSTVWGSIAATFALNGSPIGILLWVLFNCTVYLPFRFASLFLAYKEGVKLVTTMKDRLQALTNSATLLGIMVVGALIPTVVKVNIPFVYKNGKVKMNFQDMLNDIMPALIPILLVGLAYWLLGQKKLNSSRVIWIMLILSIVLYNLKILG